MKCFALVHGLACVIVLAMVTSLTAQDPPAAIAKGQAATDFELATFGDEKVSLSQFQGEDGKFVVVTFVRAHW